jgi:HPt (histidine-containing phosphotransfer) domain-containing protein
MVITVEVDQDLEEIVPGFLENRQQELVKINQAIESSDFDTLQVIGHKLAGNAGGYGFATLGEFGAQMENSARKRELGTIKQMRDEIKKYLSEVEVKYV